MLPTKTTALLAFAALAVPLTACSTSVGVGKPASPDGFAIHSGDLNSSPEELAPWRRFEVDADGNRYLPARTALPERITTRDGEVRSGDDACYWAGGDLLMSDPPLCTVDIAVENGGLTAEGVAKRLDRGGGIVIDPGSSVDNPQIPVTSPKAVPGCDFEPDYLPIPTNGER